MATEFAYKEVSAFSLWKIIRKFWYWILILLIILPSTISAINTGIETKNPAYPFLILGTTLVASDNVIASDVRMLQQDPAKVIGMEKPETGLWKKFIYGWKFFINVIFKMFGNIMLIFLPLVLIYKVIKTRDTGKISSNFMLSFFIFLAFMFVVNTIFTIHGIVKGNILIQIPTNLNPYQEMVFIIANIFPFHGIISLVIYLITLFR